MSNRNTAGRSYEAAEAAIDQLLKQLLARKVCTCCVARALIATGVALSEKIAGTAEVALALEALVDDMRNGDVAEYDALN